MKKLYFLLFHLILFSCKPPEAQLGSLQKYFGEVTNPCEALMNDPSIEEGEDGRKCISYNEEFFKNSDSKNFASMQSRMGSKEKTQNYIRYMAPMGVKIMEETGLPASVCIAQAILETGWGTSPVFAKTNNMFGHSCWALDGSFKKTVYAGQPNEMTLNVGCTKRRSITERGFYLDFESPVDSLRAYADNLLYNPKTAKYYGSVREEVTRARMTGKRANREKVIQGLGSYAAGSQYRQKLAKIIADYNLNKYDELDTCSNGTNENKLPHSQCKKVDDETRKDGPLVKDIDKQIEMDTKNPPITIER